MDFITVRDNLIRAAAVMGLRQMILIGGGYLFSTLYVSGDMAEAVATAIVVAITFAYGQARGWLDKRKAIELAKSSPIGAVVK
jgi:hypothetical protein